MLDLTKAGEQLRVAYDDVRGGRYVVTTRIESILRDDKDGAFNIKLQMVGKPIELPIRSIIGNDLVSHLAELGLVPDQCRRIIIDIGIDRIVEMHAQYRPDPSLDKINLAALLLGDKPLPDSMKKVVPESDTPPVACVPAPDDIVEI